MLRYYESQGRPEADLAYVRWCVQQSLYECQVAFNGFFENLPNRVLAAILHRIVFPWGDAWERPSDRLDHEIVQTMWSDSELRRRLTQYAFIGSDESDPAFIIEDAFLKAMATKATRDAIKVARRKGLIKEDVDPAVMAAQAVAEGICTAADAEAYVAAEAARDRAIQVDEHENLDFARQDVIPVPAND